MAVAALALAPLSSASGGDAEHDEARRLFLEGRALLVERRCDVALPKLQRSNELLPSPNSALLAARCLRELGRVEEAAERFAAVGADAQGRVAAGEEKYQETADAARAEGALLRATLGVLRIRVADAPAGTVVETAALRRPVAADGTAELLHRPGTVTLTTRAPSRPAVRRTVTVVAGRWTTVEVTLPPADSVAAPRATERGGASSWVLPTGVVLGGAGLVGVGVFAALGRCRSRPTSAWRCCGARGAATPATSSASRTRTPPKHNRRRPTSRWPPVVSPSPPGRC
ncbi:MAG: hypothetical protein WKG00_15300 [Polyangiaceae bacterium]